MHIDILIFDGFDDLVIHYDEFLDASPTLGFIRQLREHPGTRRSSMCIASNVS